MPLARFMFDRQADSYDADPEEREHAWRAPHIQEFWLAEASAVYYYLNPYAFIKEEDDGT